MNMAHGVRTQPVIVKVFVQKPHGMRPFQQVQVPDHVFALLQALIKIEMVLFQKVSPHQFDPAGSEIIRHGAVIFIQQTELQRVQQFPPAGAVGSRAKRAGLRQRLSFRIRHIAECDQVHRIARDRHDRFQQIRFPQIIRICTDDPFPACCPQARVPRRRQTPVLLMDHPDTRVFFRILFADHRAAIRRTIVHKNDLDILIRLFQNAVHTGLKIGFHLVDRNDDADQRLLRTLCFHPHFLQSFSALILTCGLPCFKKFEKSPLNRSRNKVPSLSGPQPPRAG